MKFRAFDPIELKNDIEFGIVSLAIEKILPDKNQPRKDFDQQSLEELSSSIVRYGLIQPIIVKKLGEDQYQIIAGERRWRASRLAGLKEILAIIKDEDDKNNMAIALIENIQRKELNPIELAEAFYDLNSTHGLTHETIAKMVGKKRETISNLLRLLNLGSHVKELLVNGKLEMGHAKVLLPLAAEHQTVIANNVIEKNLSVRETERLIQLHTRNTQSQNQAAEFSDFKNSEEIEKWEKTLSQILSGKVSVKMNGKGEGKVTIHFTSPNEVDWLVKKLQVK